MPSSLETSALSQISQIPDISGYKCTNASSQVNSSD